MQRISRARIVQFGGLLGLATLVTVLTFCQVSWSEPIRQIPAPELATRLDTASAPLILDVRSPAEFAEGHVPSAINIPYREIPARLSEIDEFATDEVVVYCEVGVRAGIAELVLVQAGFERIRMLEGHMQEWRRAGLPIATLPVPATP